MPQEIYLDHAAATPTDRRVVLAMNRAMRLSGNPSSFNDAGRRAAAALESARAGVAKFLHARAGEIVFCSSGSEANTLALAGAKHILTQPTEHLSVLRAAGKRAKYITVDELGFVNPDNLVHALDSKTQVVSVMYANNEIGTIQPIVRIGRAIAQWRRAHHSAYPLFHVDACQATTYLDMDVQRLGVDLLTLNGAKAYGPHGAAVLFVRRGAAVSPIVLGGSQESGRRAGTEDVPSAVGLAAALALVKKSESTTVARLRDRLIEGVLVAVPDAHVNGPLGSERLANNANISIPGTDSENLLLELDKRGIQAGSGSACTAHSVEPSHVLRALKTPKKYLDGVLRFSLGRHTTKKEIDAVLKILPTVVRRIRSRSIK
ncbi:MAG: cysteine desulfurase family protein [Patescibacteria group bacterium]